MYFVPDMTTALSKKCQISLPEPVLEQLHLVPGEDFEICVEDNDTITLHRVSQPANRGLVDLLLASRAQFEIPPREIDDSEPPAL
jgi:antitoxin component of MazEF toxin-antitoxin module